MQTVRPMPERGLAPHASSRTHSRVLRLVQRRQMRGYIGRGGTRPRATVAERRADVRPREHSVDAEAALRLGVRAVRAGRGRRRGDARAARGARSRPGGVARRAGEPAPRRRGAPRERPVTPGRRARAGDRRPRVGAATGSPAAWARHNGPAVPPPKRRRAANRPAREPNGAQRSEHGAEARRRVVAGARRRCSCRCRGCRAAWSRGRPAAASAASTPSGSPTMLTAVERAERRAGRATIRVGARRRARRRARDPGRRGAGLAGRRRRRSGRRRHRAERALARPGRDLGGRAHRARRDGPAAAAAQAQQRQRPRVERLVLGALDAGARRLRRGSSRLAESMPGVVCAFDPKIDARALDPLGAHRHGRRDLPRQRPPARAARAAAARAHRRRRRPKPSSPASTAARSTRRCASRARSRRASSSGRASVTGERERLVVRLDPPDSGNAWHLAVFASGPQGRARADRARDRQRGLGPRPRSKTRPRASSACCPRSRGPGGTRRGQVILEPGRSVGADDRHRPAARRGRLRRARARAVAAQAVAVVARVRRRGVGVGGRREPARERALVGGVRRRRALGGRHRAARQGSAPAHPLRRALGRDRPRRPRGGGRGAGRTRQHHRAVGRGDAAPRARHRRLAAARRRRRRRRRLGRRPARGRGRCRVVAGRRSRRLRRRAPQLPVAKRWRGSASSTRPASAAASRSTWASARRPRCWRTCSPARARAPRW